MVDQRLPTVDGDDGEWGEILNQFLSKEHYDTGVNNAANGGHKTITVRAGTTGAGTAPLKFTSGSLMTTPEVGAIEFLTDRLYFTVTTSTVRRTIAAYNDASGATGDIYYRDSSGNFTRLGIGSTNDVLKVSGGLPVWAAASGGTPGGSTTHVQYNSSGAFAGSANFTYNTGSSPNLLLTAAASSHIPLRVKAAASQSVSLQEWTDSSNNPLVSINQNGALIFGADTSIYRSGTAALGTNSTLSLFGSSLKFGGSTSGMVTVQAQAVAGTYTLTLPNNDGNDSDALTSDGAGNLSWVAKANSANAMGVVVHGATSSTARPTGYLVVHWIGSVAPTNAIDDDVWIDTSVAGGTQVYSEFVYNSAGLQVENRFNDWGSLITAMGSAEGPKRITFEQSETLPNSDYNFDYVTLSGDGTPAFLGQIVITFPTGVTVSSWKKGAVTGGLNLVSTSTAAIVTFSASLDSFTLDNATIRTSAAGAFFNVSNLGGLQAVDLIGAMFTQDVGVGGPIFNLATPLSTAYFFIGAGVSQLTMTGTEFAGSGSYGLFAMSSAASPDWNRTQTALAPFAVEMESKSHNIGYDNSTSGLVSTTVKTAIDEVAAGMGGGGGGMTWNTVTGTSQTAVVDNGYITDNAALVTVTLPTTAAVGKTVAIAGKGAGGWQLAQNASEIIYFGNATTTTGTGGYLASTHRRDCVTVVCITADTEWEVVSSVGSITYL